MLGDSAKREVSPEDKALSADWLKRIADALSKRKDDEKRFDRARKWLRGIDPETDKKVRTNLHFGNLAAMRPQVYAKDPEFSVTLTKAVLPEQQEVMQRFALTGEAVVDQLLVREAKLKRRAKRQLTSAYATSVGWLKCMWQEERVRDPLIVNQIKDTQDNLERIRRIREDAAEADHSAEQELQAAKLSEALEGLQAQPEIIIAKGVALDFVLPEDVLILDKSVREVGDYDRSDAMAHRVWMTREQYKGRFGYECAAGKGYREQSNGTMQSDSTAADKASDLLAVWEVWDQASGRVYTVCEGEEGFCKPAFGPDWTGERWYPFFLLAFNEVDASYFPLSDVELIEELVREYNRNRDDLVRDRKGCLPLNVIRSGGSLTPDDVRAITNREGGDVVVVKGTPGKPLNEDIFSGSLGQLNPENYDTAPARQDIEMMSGGGDAARGSVLKAKTATEAEILSQGLRGRSAERTDIIEDMLSELGQYVLEMALRKLTAEEVKTVAGPNAVWPEMTAEEVFQQVVIRVRGGSTGKPDRLQEQDRWTKLLPVIEKAMAQVSELRQAGQEDMAQAVISLVRETLRRFDERIEIERFLPEPKEGEEGSAEPPGVAQAKALIQDLQAQLAQMRKALDDKRAEIEADVAKARYAADAQARSAEEVARINGTASVEVARAQAAGKVLTTPAQAERDELVQP